MKPLVLLRLFITYWPIIKPILPVLLELVKRHEGALRGLLDRPETTHADDTKDFMQEVTKKEKWDPFKKYWED